jgi:hypothetical protein
VKSEGRRGSFVRCGLEWIWLHDVDSRLKLLFRHGRTFSLLLRTFSVMLDQRS